MFFLLLLLMIVLVLVLGVSDCHMRDNDWGDTVFPLFAGHEVIGTVVAVGSSVTDKKIGDRVGFGWIKDSCRTCEPCVAGTDNLCKKGFTGLITAGNRGGFSQFVRAPADFAFLIPDELPSEYAAPLLCAG
jgi:uncharacterized zinc-type alcohol dehydrogenase-like protein